MSFSDGILALFPGYLSSLLSRLILVLAERSGYIAIIAEAKSMYVMIESTLWFDDVRVVPGLLLVQFKGHTCGQDSGAGDILGTRP